MEKKYKGKSLKFNIFLIFLAMALGLNFVMISISIFAYSNTINTESRRTSVGVANSVASGINGNRINDWLNERRMDEYKQAEEDIINVVRSNGEIGRITVCRMLPDSMQIVFSVDRHLNNTNYLTRIPYNINLAERKNDLLYGYQIEPIKYSDDAGEHIMALTPIKTSVGEVVGYAICEMSLNGLANELSFFAGVLLMVLAVASLVVCGVYIYLKSTLISPISRINKILQQFADDNRLGEKTKAVLLNSKQNKIKELSLMNHHFAELIDDVHDRNDKMEDLSGDVIKNVSNMVNKRNIEDTSNVDAIKEYTIMIFDNMKRKRKYRKQLTEHLLDAMITAVPLYDLGEIEIPNDILNKTGKLTKDEFDIIKRHTQGGAAAIDDVMKGWYDDFYIDVAKQIALYHHERIDGSGYMKQLTGNKIPLPARIVAVVDVFNALVSNTAYRRGKSIDEALDIIKEGRGRLYDKDVVDAFLEGENSIRRIARKYSQGKN